MAGCPYCGAELVPPYAFCSKCGQPLAAPAAYPPPGYAPPPHKTNTALIIVIVVVLLVAVPTILAAVLYVMVSGLITTNPTGKPVIVLSVTKTSTGADILVVGVQPAAAPSNFKLNMEVNTTFGLAVPAPTTTGTTATVVVAEGGTAGTHTFTITWQNPGGSGTVVTGDHFTVTYVTTGGSMKPSTGTPVTFILLWSDGSQVATGPWQV